MKIKVYVDGWISTMELFCDVRDLSHAFELAWVDGDDFTINNNTVFIPYKKMRIVFVEWSPI